MNSCVRIRHTYEEFLKVSAGEGPDEFIDGVVEIASPTTRSKDRGKKLNWYRRCGVKECWLVDPEAQDIQVLILGEKKIGYYKSPEKIKVSILDDCEIDLSLVFPETEQE